MVMVTRLVVNKEGKGEGGKGDCDGDDGGGRRRGNGDGGKSDGDGDNGGGRAMAMATKRVMVMVMATRVGEGGGRRNGHWRRRQERLLRRQGWRARNSIQGDGEGNGDTMATLRVRGQQEDKTTARRGAAQQPDGAIRRREGGAVRGRKEDKSAFYWRMGHTNAQMRKCTNSQMAVPDQLIGALILGFSH